MIDYTGTEYTDYIRNTVRISLDEDIGDEDITSNLIDVKSVLTFNVRSNENAILCGTKYFNEVFRQIDPDIHIDWFFEDGIQIERNDIICSVSGPTRNILIGERVALNFLQMLSGTSTITKKFVDEIRNTKAKLLDTRKTIPGLRIAQKYAVKCGGGTNHRINLNEMILIKDNHVSILGIRNLIESARKKYPNKKLEIEVDTNEQLAEAIQYDPDIIMLDNFNIEIIRTAIEKRRHSHKEYIEFEVSGNISIYNIREIANTGVEYISVGSITKDIKAIDLSMDNVG